MVRYFLKTKKACVQYLLVGIASLLGTSLSGQSVPTAIFTDPPADAAHPAHMTVLSIPTHGAHINGIIYQPSGSGAHPTLVVFHGLPGNEKSLDLAQAVRRAGWNAVAFNYRGSWGSPGTFNFFQTLEDANAVLTYLRDPANARRLDIDTHRIALLGHSMGGWVAVQTASRDHDLIAVILVSAADMGKLGTMPHDSLVAFMADCMGPLSGATPESMAQAAQVLSNKFRFENAVAGLLQTPLLALTADDGLASDTDELVHQIQVRGGRQVEAVHVKTDHNWSDHRIDLESKVLTWLSSHDRSPATDSKPVATQ
jgi:pimeloyl-ACP methyl ester carboxylesterase